MISRPLSHGGLSPTEMNQRILTPSTLDEFSKTKWRVSILGLKWSKRGPKDRAKAQKSLRSEASIVYGKSVILLLKNALKSFFG